MIPLLAGDSEMSQGAILQSRNTALEALPARLSAVIPLLAGRFSALIGVIYCNAVPQSFTPHWTYITQESIGRPWRVTPTWDENGLGSRERPRYQRIC
jgi:hypothetical protein